MKRLLCTPSFPVPVRRGSGAVRDELSSSVKQRPLPSIQKFTLRARVRSNHIFALPVGVCTYTGPVVMEKKAAVAGSESGGGCT